MLWKSNTALKKTKKKRSAKKKDKRKGTPWRRPSFAFYTPPFFLCWKFYANCGKHIEIERPLEGTSKMWAWLMGRTFPSWPKVAEIFRCVPKISKSKRKPKTYEEILRIEHWEKKKTRRHETRWQTKNGINNYV